MQRYVPGHVVKRIGQWATYDEVKGAWSIRRLDYAGNNQKRFQKRVRGSNDKTQSNSSHHGVDQMYFQYDKDSETGISVMRRRKKRGENYQAAKKKSKRKKKKKSRSRKKERSEGK